MKPQALLSKLALLGSIPFAIADTLNIVAHQDDDLLFLSPDLIRDILSGQAVRTIFLTAGDAGQGTSYWQSRQLGSQAAYARMAIAGNSWTETDAGIPGKDISIYTLSENSSISLIFLHLPDGNMDGTGWAADHNDSLQKLWDGAIDHITTVDGSGTTYTRDELIHTLTSLIDDFQPDELKTQDYHNSFGDGDHSDHYATAFFATSALNDASPHPDLTGYLGYAINNNPVNLDASDIEDKTNIFYEYAVHDQGTCSTATSCSTRPESGWLQRQYTV
ncbi:F5/8 type C domain protein [Aspergillus indologenus CBS 114.80]|uniref:N-acetylglucosaminylphosphatidylinositol deacetylase n=1 Tax=Aspergillus indologenus CBS 114.80 TaxID=1450541 RepID=A0A2V5I4K3_9EURO|nr:F5/8 type C domain protein [Aspergillus indologenus CBS 114.80]